MELKKKYEEAKTKEEVKEALDKLVLLRSLKIKRSLSELQIS